MRENEKDTPPSSVSGDEIAGMEEEGLEGVIYLDEIDDFDDDMMEEVDDQEEEDNDMNLPDDHAHRVFDKHLGSVFCGNLSPDGKLAVTGGEDDKAFVWNPMSGAVVMECTGHKDSVVFVGFSFDGAFLATGDMSGVLKVWKCNTENSDPWTVVFEYETDDLTWGQWHHSARVLLCGTIKGDVFVFKIPSGETKVLQGNNSKVECGKVFRDGLRLAVGYEDGSVKIWDIKNGSVLHQLQPGVHEIRVTAIDTHEDNILVASISTDGKVILTKSTDGKVIGQLQTDPDLESISFSGDGRAGFFALGTLHGIISVWDVARQMIRHHCAKSTDENVSGVTKLLWVSSTYLVAGCLDGSLRVYEGRTGEQLQVYTGHKSEILDLCFNEQENIFLTTSDDGTARIFKYQTE